jgi:hypothetical protein
VILPECWQEWSPAQLAAVMAHEREHARRRDPLVQWMALLNRAVFWFHPLAWYLEKHLSRLAEEACDAAVLAQGHDPYEYSRSLLDIAQSVVRSGARVHVWGMAMPGSGLTRRVRQILEGRPAPRLSRARMAFAAIGCAVLSTAFVATAVARRTPPPPIAQAAAPRTETPPPQSQTPPARPAPRPPVRTAATPDQTPADQRMLVLFFDLGEMTEADLARSVAAAQRIGLSQLRSQDLMAVMTYSGGGTLKVMQDFTNNRDRLIETLQQVTGASLKDGEVATAGRRSAALSEAIQKLGVVKEKKALIFFTSGASNGQATSEEAKALSDAAVSAKVAIYAIDVRGFPAQ